MKTSLFPSLQSFIEGLDLSSISNERKNVLTPLATYISERLKSKENININFICTHNSRRSHLGQIWAQTMASYFSLPQVKCYSGGTEATAVYPQITETLAHVGFSIDTLSEGKNPVYAVKHGNSELPNIAFSKKYDHPFNPTNNFAAALTCSQADQDCPLIFGAEARFALDYKDPKEFDNTPMKTEKYQERSTQIATEMFFVFSEATKK
jgi:arsenate reductase